MSLPALTLMPLSTLRNKIGKAFHVPLVAALASHGDGGEMAEARVVRKDLE